MNSLVVFDISLSVDGFVRGPDPGPGNVLGYGSEALHAWACRDAAEEDRRLLADGIGGAGAVICGRRTYDDSISGWGADGPTGDARLPVFVVSHSTPSPVPGGAYHFARGIASALACRSVIMTRAATHLRYGIARPVSDHAVASSAKDQDQGGQRS